MNFLDKEGLAVLWANILDKINSNKTTIDTTLTQEGQAADAKIVGDALAEKQPVGDYALKTDLVQPDWNQNDPEAADYVKNRTHYKGVEKISYHTLTEVTHNYSFGRGFSTVVSAIQKNHLNSSELIVELDGTRYENVPCFYQAQYMMGGSQYYIVGNPYIFTDKNPDIEYEDNGLPFCVYYTPGLGMSGYILLADTTATAMFEMYEENAVLNLLSTEYLPTIVPVIPTATAGQAVVVKAVGTNGEPTEWETIDALSSAITIDPTLTKEGQAADAKAVGDALSNIKPGNIEPAIIDAITLPETDIREDVFYRLLTAEAVNNQYVQNDWTYYCVETLPEVGEPITLDQVKYTVYHNVSDNTSYGYISDALTSVFGVSTGWHTVEILLTAIGESYSGVVIGLENATLSDTYYTVLSYVNYTYKDGWTKHKTIGWTGTGSNAEIFNHPSNIASGDSSHAEGHKTSAEGESSHAEGRYSYAEGYASHAEGHSSRTEGYASHAEGRESHAEGDYSHAEGDSSHAEGSYSHAEGYKTHAEGDISHAEGYKSHAEGESSHAEGATSHAKGYASHAEGEDSYAESDYSHAEGYKTHAEGSSSHVEGYETHAEGRYSHVEGRGEFVELNLTGDANATVYTSNASLPSQIYIGMTLRMRREGESAGNKVGYTYSTAKVVSFDTTTNTITVDRTLSDIAVTDAKTIGYYAGMALSDYTHVEGNRNIAAGANQHVQGRFNVQDPEYNQEDKSARGKYLHIVGNGTSHTERSNAHTLDWDGLGWFAGGLKIGGTNQDDEAAVTVATSTDLENLKNELIAYINETFLGGEW